MLEASVPHQVDLSKMLPECTYMIAQVPQNECDSRIIKQPRLKPQRLLLPNLKRDRSLLVLNAIGQSEQHRDVRTPYKV